MAMAASLALMSNSGRALAASIGARGRDRRPGFGPRLAWKYRQPAYEHTMTHVRSIRDG
jgi:hypothetical protein